MQQQRPGFSLQSKQQGWLIQMLIAGPELAPKRETLFQQMTRKSLLCSSICGMLPVGRSAKPLLGKLGCGGLGWACGCSVHGVLQGRGEPSLERASDSKNGQSPVSPSPGHVSRKTSAGTWRSPQFERWLPPSGFLLIPTWPCLPGLSREEAASPSPLPAPRPLVLPPGATGSGSWGQQTDFGPEDPSSHPTSQV